MCERQIDKTNKQQGERDKQEIAAQPASRSNPNLSPAGHLTTELTEQAHAQQGIHAHTHAQSGGTPCSGILNYINTLIHFPLYYISPTFTP